MRRWTSASGRASCPCISVVSATPDAALLRDARSALAAVIVLDQFSRNMFRGDPRAFASDAKALAIADAAIGKGYLGELSKDERLFLYLPFEHCEDRAQQARCVQLMSELGDPELTRYAVAHRDIIERFGRFPHRNAILGRTSTRGGDRIPERAGQLVLSLRQPEPVVPILLASAQPRVEWRLTCPL